MSCQKCGSERIAQFNAKCSDACFVSIGDKDMEGYVPHGMNVGWGDYLEFSMCLDCGQHQGQFPLPLTDLENV